MTVPSSPCRRCGLALRPLLALIAVIFPAGAQTTADLFQAAPSDQVAPPELPPAFTVVRTRQVAVGKDFLSNVQRIVEKQRGPLRVRLFDDAEHVFLRTRVERLLGDRGFQWFGRLPGASLEGAVLSVLDGRLSGSFTVDDRFYRLEPLRNGYYRVSELSVDRPAGRGEDVVTAPAGSLDPNVALAKLGVGQSVLGSGVSTVDILGVYTPAARNRAGGSQAIQDKIALAVAEANASFANSAIPMAFRLAGMAQVDAQGAEAASADYLNEITFNRPDIAALRDYYGADLVAMFIDGPGAGGGSVGIGWLYQGQAGFAPYAYGISETNWAVGPSYTFPHEAGHNMGLAHDRDHSLSSGAFSYSYGYQHTTTPKFYTIMAYSAGCSGCKPLNYWSNPQIHYGDPVTPTGIAAPASDSADSALTLTQTGPVVAGWRAATNPSVNSNPIAYSQSVQTDSGASVAVTLTGSDPDNDPIRFQLVSQPANGTLTGSGADWTYQPAASFSGHDEFDFEVYDHRGGFATATVSISVEGGEPPPPSGPLTVEALKASANTAGWTAVGLTQSFSSPVPVCTPEYAIGAPPAVVRVQGLTTSGFQIRLARLDGAGATFAADVECFVVEEGVYTVAEHGVALEAGLYASTATDRAGYWSGQPVAYRQSYASPVVVGQVTSANDPRFSVFWARSGGSQLEAPDAASMRLGKHVGEDPNPGRTNETVAYIVVEAGAGSLPGYDFEAGIGPVAVVGTDNGASLYGLDQLAGASFAVLASAGMRGGNGGWPVLAAPDAANGAELNLFIEEDQVRDSERSHIAESVAYIALSPQAGAVNLPPTADDQAVHVEAGGSVGITLTGSDAESDPLAFSIESGPTYGSLSGQAPDLTYVPNSGYNGPDSFTFRVDDQVSGFDIGTVSITVDPDETALPPPPSGPTVEALVASATTAGWTSVSLSQSFSSPVPVCTPEYVVGAPPAVVRLQGVTSSGFQVRFARLDGSDVTLAADVQCFVVEEGVYTAAEHGVTLEAGFHASTVTDRLNNWSGETVPYTQAYASPVVVGQVTSANDSRFSVFWAGGSASHIDPPDPAAMRLGKHVGEDPDPSRVNETVAYIVIEAGAGSLPGYDFEAGVSPAAVLGSDNGESAYSLNQFVDASFAVLASAGMRGGNGGWPVLAAPNAVSGSDLRLFLEEDQLRDAERAHIAESVAYIALAPQEPAANLPPTAVDQSVEVEAGGSAAVTLTGWDPEEDPLTFSIESGPAHGSLSGQVPNVTYTPNSGYDGPDSFTFRVDDQVSGFDIGTVSITVHPAEATPPPPPPSGPTVEALVASASTAGWTSVSLSQSFSSPVPVCTPEYVTGAPPAVVRLQGLSPSSFEIRLARLDGSNSTVGADVQCFVVEEGVYTAAEHGVALEAGFHSSTVTDRLNNWTGESVAYRQNYAAPVVVGQVASTGDPRFSVFWAGGASHTEPPDAGAMRLGKHVAEDPSSNRANETVGYIVIEAGAGALPGYDFEARVGPVTVEGPNIGPTAYALSQLADPSFAVLASAGMRGGNGGWPVLAAPGAVGGSELNLFIEEDQLNDRERAHIAESVAYIALSPRE